MYEENETISNKTENIKGKQTKVLGLKSTINKMKNSLQGFKADWSKEKKGPGNLNKDNLNHPVWEQK